MTISIKRVVKILSWITFFLVAASLSGQILKYFCGIPKAGGFVFLFNVDEEVNIPTYFSCLLLLISSALLWVISRIKTTAKDPYRYYWCGLAFIFLLMSMDEMIGFHEYLGYLMQKLFHAHNFFYYEWVIPAITFLIVFFAFYLKFLIHLPRVHGMCFIASGFVYVLGAVVVEMVEGKHYELIGHEDFCFNVLTTIEESLEMAGIIMFIYALLKYLQNEAGLLQISFDE